MDKMEIKVRGGTLVCYPAADPDNPGVCVMYRPDGIDFEFDLVYIENTDIKLGMTRLPEDIRIMVYSDVWSEDYQHHYTIDGNEVRDLVDVINKEEKGEDSPKP